MAFNCLHIGKRLVGHMIDTGIIGCGLAVIAPLKLFVLHPWSYTSMISLVNIDFGVGTVEGCAQFFLWSIQHTP